MASNFSYKIIDNSKQFLKLAESAKQKALTKIALAWDGHVVELVPVDTGNLRNSRGYELRVDSVVVGFAANYAAFVELGTRTMAAQPFLRPSIERFMDEYKQIIIDAYKSA